MGAGAEGARAAGLRMTHPQPPQLVQECNASVQSMKRTEELIHLSKKIHFEGKVRAHRGRVSTRRAVLVPFFPGGCRPMRHCPHPSLACALCPAAPGLTSSPSSPSPSAQIFPLISQARWLVRHGELVELAPLPAAPPAKLKLSSKAVYLHLFNDCLLLSRRKE